jgi:hypothetical protein
LVKNSALEKQGWTWVRTRTVKIVKNNVILWGARTTRPQYGTAGQEFFLGWIIKFWSAAGGPFGGGGVHRKYLPWYEQPKDRIWLIPFDKKKLPGFSSWMLVALRHHVCFQGKSCF